MLIDIINVQIIGVCIPNSCRSVQGSDNVFSIPGPIEVTDEVHDMISMAGSVYS